MVSALSKSTIPYRGAISGFHHITHNGKTAIMMTEVKILNRINKFKENSRYFLKIGATVPETLRTPPQIFTEFRNMASNGVKYSRMGQVTFVEDSLHRLLRGMVKFFKNCLPNTLLVHS